ncbi:MAG: hypothetical protein K9N06_02510 [Candidatus Cloacimonetes bacterium]|nr:hypothetical protein [Candidatus Cloacimonadota bacterium]
MMKNFVPRLFVLILVSFLLTGCLTSEFKEYRFRINADGSGSGSIKFVNLVSEEDDGKDVSFSDFDELVNNYLQGDTFENDNPLKSVTSKILFEENGVLCGKVEFTFANYQENGFFKYEGNSCAPVMYYLGDLGETFIESDGEHYAGDADIPIIIWAPDTKEFYFKTNVKDDMTDAHNLLELYNLWKLTQD